MGFMNWLMKGVGFENENVYDDTAEKQKKHEEKLRRKEEERRRREEYKAQKAQEKADRVAKKYAFSQKTDNDTKSSQPGTVSYMDNPDQYNTSSYNSTSNNYGVGSNVGGYGSKNVEFLYPTKFEDVLVVIKYLKENESVVLNLNDMNEYDSQRLLDCASGAICALNGNIRRVENNIFLLTPEGYNIKTPNQNQNQQ